MHVIPLVSTLTIISLMELRMNHAKQRSVPFTQWNCVFQRALHHSKYYFTPRPPTRGGPSLYLTSEDILFFTAGLDRNFWMNTFVVLHQGLCKPIVHKLKPVSTTYNTPGLQVKFKYLRPKCWYIVVPDQVISVTVGLRVHMIISVGWYIIYYRYDIILNIYIYISCW